MKELLGYAAYIAWWWRYLVIPYAAITTTAAALFTAKVSCALGALGGSLLGWLLITAIYTYVGWTAKPLT